MLLAQGDSDRDWGADDSESGAAARQALALAEPEGQLEVSNRTVTRAWPVKSPGAGRGHGRQACRSASEPERVPVIWPGNPDTMDKNHLEPCAT